MTRATAVLADGDAVFARVFAVARHEAVGTRAVDAGLTRSVAEARDVTPGRAATARAVATEPIAAADQPARHPRGALHDVLGVSDDRADVIDAGAAGCRARCVGTRAGVARGHTGVTCVSVQRREFEPEPAGCERNRCKPSYAKPRRAHGPVSHAGRAGGCAFWPAATRADSVIPTRFPGSLGLRGTFG